MDENHFNMEIRKFLKNVGVTSQREIENAVHEALRDGKLEGNETLSIRASLAISALDFQVEIDGEIELV